MTALAAAPREEASVPAHLRHIHLPTPGDHYSPLTGSATITVIYETARWHERDGGETQVIVGRGARGDYEAGRCRAVDFPPPLGRSGKLADLLSGWMGGERRHEVAAYLPALDAIPPAFDGWIFVHNAPAAAAAIKCHRPKAQVALYAHNELFRTFTDREVRRLVAGLDRVICVSDFIANDLLGRLGGPSGKVRVVRNGVDLQRFHPPVAPPRNAVPVILFLGRVVWHKGADLLLRAAQLLAAQGHDFMVRIVGSGGFDASLPLSAFEHKLRALARPLGARVEFRPFVDRAAVLAEFAEGDIFCIPSNCDDPCPLTALEGLACGLPVVASRRGGIPEICGDAALYFAPPDYRQLAEQLAKLLRDPAQRIARGRSARARAEGLSWETTYRKLQEALVA